MIIKIIIINEAKVLIIIIRLGDHEFYGPGPEFVLDTTKPFTVVTQVLLVVTLIMMVMMVMRMMMGMMMGMMITMLMRMMVRMRTEMPLTRKSFAVPD